MDLFTNLHLIKNLWVCQAESSAVILHQLKKKQSITKQPEKIWNIKVIYQS